MSTKYKVTVNDELLGHYYSTDPVGAVKKAIDANKPYIGSKLKADDAKFSAQKGILNPKFSFTWNELPQEWKDEI